MSKVEDTLRLIKTGKAWLERQEQIFNTTNQLPDFTKDHIETLSKLLSLSPPTPTPPEPDISGENWIGQLMQHLQANPATRGHQPVFSDIPVPSPNGVIRWRCEVVIAGHPGPFPQVEDWKPLGHASAPSWAKKKEAKQYACKCALQSLCTAIVKNTTEAKSQKNRAPVSSSAFQGQTSAQNGNGADGVVDNDDDDDDDDDDGDNEDQGCGFKNTEFWLEQPKTKQFYECKEAPDSAIPPDELPGRRSANKRVLMELDDDQPVTQQVVELCRKLGIQPPIYNIQLSASNPGGGIKHQVFNGHADWKNEAPRGLSNIVGEVSGILSKKGCKEKIAEEVLKVLESVRQERGENLRRALAADIDTDYH